MATFARQVNVSFESLSGSRDRLSKTEIHDHYFGDAIGFKSQYGVDS
ncbi:hypothetical protein [Bacillus glycinifermentans]|nr:hypothetical protein [Bacillus glycinifermentans]UOY86809.1 hypothetical protein MW696_11850 [Bacillus glycinifermentans]